MYVGPCRCVLSQWEVVLLPSGMSHCCCYAEGFVVSWQQ